MNKIINCVFASYPKALSAKKKIMEEIKDIEKQNSKNKKNEKLSREILNNQQNKCFQNKSAIESKAKSNMLGITLAFSIIFASFGLMMSESAQSLLLGFRVIIVFIPIFIGVLYLLLGGIAALQALQIGKWYDLSLEEETNLNKSSYKKYIELNSLTNIIRSNFTTVSQISTRNGILSLAIFVFIMTVLLMISYLN